MKKSTKQMLLVGGGLAAAYYFFVMPSNAAVPVVIPVPASNAPPTAPVGGSAAPLSALQSDIQNWIAAEPNLGVRNQMIVAVNAMSPSDLSLLDVIYEYINQGYNPALLTTQATAFYNTLVAKNVGFHW
jgi:hypothetical protein